MVATARCPVCGVLGEPLMLPIHLQAVHGYGQPAIAGPAEAAGQTIIQRPYGEQQPVWPTYGLGPGPLPLGR